MTKGYWQEEHKAWLGYYWVCSDCEEENDDGPFEDYGKCEECVNYDFDKWMAGS
jgi:hypothetical protein